jgi:hypothetical protein
MEGGPRVRPAPAASWPPPHIEVSHLVNIDVVTAKEAHLLQGEPGVQRVAEGD